MAVPRHPPIDLKRTKATSTGELSFIDPERGGYGGILPEVVIFAEGDSPREISPLRVIFHSIPRAEGL